jgi:hypothetical protein
MNEQYADNEDFFFEEEELTPEEQAKADEAQNRQWMIEAYADFLQAPYAFD